MSFNIAFVLYPDFEELDLALDDVFRRFCDLVSSPVAD